MTKDMTTVTPITPQEVKDKRFIPIAIIEAVNELKYMLFLNIIVLILKILILMLMYYMMTMGQ